MLNAKKNRNSCFSVFWGSKIDLHVVWWSMVPKKTFVSDWKEKARALVLIRLECGAIMDVSKKSSWECRSIRNGLIFFYLSISFPLLNTVNLHSFHRHPNELYCSGFFSGVLKRLSCNCLCGMWVDFMHKWD